MSHCYQLLQCGKSTGQIGSIFKKTNSHLLLEPESHLTVFLFLKIFKSLVIMLLR